MNPPGSSLTLSVAGVVLAFVVSWWLTGRIRGYAVRHRIVDVPNARSSHQVPTPRGGGLAIVLVVLAGMLVLLLAGELAAPAFWGLAGAGLIVAGMGWLDDHGHVPAVWRLVAHALAAVWGLFWLGGVPDVTFVGRTVDLGWLGDVLGVLFLVWLLNLYNFMDGIDGIAGMEAVTVGSGIFFLSLLQGYADGLSTGLPLVVAGACAGFLVWNLPRARIFMGDAGSGFLGVTLGLMALHAAARDPDLFWAWLVLLGVFVVDATWTLFCRLARGERIHEAHRDHIYQKLARKVGSHLPVTSGVGLINLFWLLPLAALIVTDRIDGTLALGVAYLPLLLLAGFVTLNDRSGKFREGRLGRG